MKYATLFFTLLALSLTAAFGEIPATPFSDPDPAWHACNNAGDCTLVNGFCNKPEAVNRRYRQQYEAFVSSSGPAACTLLPPPQSICITCKQSRCTAKVKRATSLK